MAGNDFLNKIREIEKEASTLIECAEKEANLNMEKARNEASAIVEQAYKEAGQRRGDILADADRKVKALSDSVNEKSSTGKLKIPEERLKLAVENVAERIVNTLEHR